MLIKIHDTCMFLYYDDDVVSIVAELLLNPKSHTTTLNKLEKNKNNINYNPFVIIFLLALYKSQIKINK